MQTKAKKKAKASSVPRLRAIFASVTPLTAAPAVEAQNLKGFTCANCSSTFALNQLVIAGAAEGEQDAVEPMCPDCGSPEVSASEEEFDFDQLTDANAVAVACNQCSTQHIFSSETMAGLQNAMNCTVCGTTVAFADDLDEEEEATLNLDDDEDITAGDDEEILDDVVDEDEETDLTDDLSDEDDAFATADTQEDEEGTSLVNAPDETVEADAADTGDGTNPEGSELDNAPADTVEADADEELEDLDLVDALESVEDEEATAKFARIGDSVIAFINEVSVGSLNKLDVPAASHAAFENPNYLKALSNSVAVAGMSNTLADFGFKRTSIKVSASRIAALSDGKVEARAAEVAAAANENFAQHFKASLGIASVGINKGFFPNEARANPLKVALVASFTAAGMKAGSAEKLVDQAFASASDKYHGLLLAKAEELLAHPVEVRNQLSTAIAGMSYSSGFRTVASDESEDEDESYDEEISTATIRTGVRPAKSVEATASFGFSDRQPTNGAAGVHGVAEGLKERFGRVF